MPNSRPATDQHQPRPPSYSSREKVSLSPQTWIALFMLIITAGGILLGLGSRLGSGISRAEVEQLLEKSTSAIKATLKERCVSKERAARLEIYVESLRRRATRVETLLDVRTTTPPPPRR